MANRDAVRIEAWEDCAVAEGYDLAAKYWDAIDEDRAHDFRTLAAYRRKMAGDNPTGRNVERGGHDEVPT